MLAVLPDTNVMFGTLTGSVSDPAWQRLLGLSAAREIDVVLPEIVQWELVNQLREGLADDVRAFDLHADKLRRMGLTPPPFREG